MLRGLKSRQLKSRMGFAQIVTTSAPTISAAVGNGNLTAVTRTSTPIIQATYRKPYRQNSVFIASQINNQGGFCSVEAASPITPQVEINDSTAAATDGTANLLYYGYDSPTIDSIPSANIVCEIDRTRVIWGRVISIGGVAIGGSDLSAVAGPTGTYTITYKKAFKRTALAFVTPITAGNYIGVKISNQTATGCTVTTSSATPVDTAIGFYFMAVGTDSRDETPRVRATPFNSQRKPRMAGIQYTVTSGTPTLSVGTKLATLTDNGAGDTSITLLTPFRREFGVFAMSGSAGTTRLQAVLAANCTSSVADVQTISVAGTLTDPTLGASVNVIYIGSEDPSEY